MDPGFQQWLQVWRSESIKAVGVRFGGAVTTIEAIIEEQGHFINRVVRGDVQRVQQVDLPVGTQLGQRDL